ncbi:transporter substrate-binding domain-containing protein [Paenibacillus radicis (ex Gao et al. 2016)]|uniref:L-cystine-binding protein TcyK n=1 Tax=Paenibacillus radicis (ex Gao et al. 2016) TaxID=1737354 RepID=A0A917H9M1_9BACL|nr:transporter substrate-binding domain-containing protein [Paenibacillus radicis (ex Gao et al. 2016)]GGG72089.1 L-cystine-binding protein TcyK [Paenibacillus radicis (ex Gao et al. 2016)]
MRKAIFSLLLAVLLAAAVSACGQSSNEGNKDKDVKKVVVGTGTKFPKVFFLDEKGELTGFDVELLKEIDKRLPQYEFEFKTSDLTNLFLSLKTNKIDLIAHQLEKNPEREAEYLFNELPYAYWKSKIIVAKDNNNPIQSLDDLKGKKAVVTANSAAATLLENYNKAHDNAIEIVYQSGAANDMLTLVTSGRVDFFIAPDFTLDIVDPQHQLKAVGEPLSATDIQYVFRKDDPDSKVLADSIDGVIKELREDGTLAALSEKWLSFDATIQ